MSSPVIYCLAKISNKISLARSYLIRHNFPQLCDRLILMGVIFFFCQVTVFLNTETLTVKTLEEKVRMSNSVINLLHSFVFYFPEGFMFSSTKTE